MSRKPRKQDRRRARQAKRGESKQPRKVNKNAAAATAAEDDSLTGYRVGKTHPSNGGSYGR